jgi:TolB protein
MTKPLTLFTLVFTCGVALMASPTPPRSTDAPVARQDQKFMLDMNGRPRKPPTLAIPSFTVLSADAETQEAAKTLTDVMRADLAYEREFDIMPAASFAGIPSSQTVEDLPYDRWTELNADYVALGDVKKSADGKQIEVAIRVVSVKERKQAYADGRVGAARLARRIAHSFADDIHKKIRDVDGVAMTRVAFSSTRDGERVGQTIEERAAKEIYIMDYDGENPQRVTSNGSLNIAPSWCPDGKCLLYTSYQARPSAYPDIVLQNVFGQIGSSKPTHGTEVNQNYMADISPDGMKIVFASARGGVAMDIWVVNRDGTGMRQLTTNPANDTSPRWSPNGTQIAFVSDRVGSPRIYTMSADGLQQTALPTTCATADRPTWAPSSTGLQIAYTCQTSQMGHDIDVYDFSTKQTRRITDGIATNESPTFAPNGRHIMFFTSRWGKTQIAEVDIDGKNLRQMTRVGTNTYPSWSGFLK